MASHVVCKVDNLPVNTRLIVELEGRSIGVFNVNGVFYALRNRCPHQAGPLCVGKVRGTALPSEPGEYLWVREGEIVCCPWHGWEFDIKTGESVYDPFRCRVRSYEVSVVEDPENWPRAETYPVTVEKGDVIVHVS